MKRDYLKHALAFVLVLCMVTTMLPVSVLAAQTVTTTPGNKSLEVEYFNSTLYNWDESAANQATKDADFKSNGVQSGKPTISQIQSGSYYLDEAMTQQVTVKSETTGSYAYTKPDRQPRYNSLASQDVTYGVTNYFHQVGSEYYPVYVSRKTTTNWIFTTTYTLYYSTDNGKTYTQCGTTNTDTDRTSDLYTRTSTSTTTYWLECNGEKVEENTTYTSKNSNVQTTLYYAGTSGTQQGKGFYFTNAGNKPADTYIPSFSKWANGNNQNFFIYSGLAEKKLSDAQNAPFSNDNVNAARLFATDGSNESYTKVYKNIRVPFVYDADTGYYTLDSDSNAVYFAGGNAQDGATMNIANRPAGFYQYVQRTAGTDYYGTGLLPFNDVNTTIRTVTKSATSGTTTAYNAKGDTIYGFGMVTEVPFQMNDNGKDAKGQDIQFEFSGDDDVWVYVDGTLVLDIGGTHDAIVGKINFATGDVTISAPYYGKVGDKNAANNPSHSVDNKYTSETLSQTNLYTALGTTPAGFAGEGQHTLKIYYMDRGQGSTNCLIKFNLPQKDSVSVSKQIADTYTGTSTGMKIPADVMESLNNVDFTFTLYKDDAPVPNKNYSLYNAQGGLLGTGSTDANGQFKLKNGQTATFKNISLDDSQTWHVVEELPSNRWTAAWEESSNVTGAQITAGTSPASDAVTVDGSETSTDTISFNCTNSYKYVSDLDVDANDETIVLDYGLPVKVDVRKNDVISGGEFQSLEIVSDTHKYGVAEVKDGQIVYTLNQEFKGIETVKYCVTAEDTQNGQIASAEATLTIIPATSVYYEENFAAMITYSDAAIKWEPVSDGKSYGLYQETGFVGDKSYHTYGADEIYLNNLGDSYGTSMKAVAEGKGAQFVYSFTGTGTAIYGRISPNTGYIEVTITNRATQKVEYRRYIDTRVIGDVATNVTLYNIPIFNCDQALNYDTYDVRVYLYKAGTPTTADGSGAEFYLDGIRVYQPMGTEKEHAEAGYDVAQLAYASDGEANLALVNIGLKIQADIADELSDGIFTLTDINGEIVNVDDYRSIGPNEEFYLNGDVTDAGPYSVTFALVNWSTQDYKLYLGMKAPSGEEASVQVGERIFELKNSADCYYDISDAVESFADDDGVNYGFVTITGENGLAALTNIKVTGLDSFQIIPGENIKPDESYDSASLFMISGEKANEILNAKEEKPQTFTPESIESVCSFNKIKKQATLQIKVSDDVVRVTINGEEATRKGTSVFSYVFKNVTADTTYEVVCYNEVGVASETYIVTR